MAKAGTGRGAAIKASKSSKATKFKATKSKTTTTGATRSKANMTGAAKPKVAKLKESRPKVAKPRVFAPKTEPTSTTPLAVTLRLGVDAGNITVSDMGFLIANGVEDFTPQSHDANLVAVLAVPKGPVSLHVVIRGARPKVDARFELDVPSGRLYVGDACVVFPETEVWRRFLKKTWMLMAPSRRMRAFFTGCDGEFVVRVHASSG